MLTKQLQPFGGQHNVAQHDIAPERRYAQPAIPLPNEPRSTQSYGASSGFTYWCAQAMTVALALRAFVLSFDALRTLAMTAGIDKDLACTARSLSR